MKLIPIILFEGSLGLRRTQRRAKSKNISTKEKLDIIKRRQDRKKTQRDSARRAGDIKHFNKKVDSIDRAKGNRVDKPKKIRLVTRKGTEVDGF
jgi:hypothetical protein